MQQQALFQWRLRLCEPSALPRALELHSRGGTDKRLRDVGFTSTLLDYYITVKT